MTASSERDGKWSARSNYTSPGQNDPIGVLERPEQGGSWAAALQTDQRSPLAAALQMRVHANHGVNV